MQTCEQLGVTSEKFPFLDGCTVLDLVVLRKGEIEAGGDTELLAEIEDMARRLERQPGGVGSRS